MTPPCATRLLAKSSGRPDAPDALETLPGHTAMVCEMADELSGHLARDVQRTFGWDADLTRLWRNAVWLGAWMHDWGKANDHFQNMLRGTQARQGVRHETLSPLLAADLHEWLAPLWASYPALVRRAALTAAAGHHLKFPDPMEDRPGTRVTLFVGHPDFRATLALGAERHALSDPPARDDVEWSLLRRGVPDRLRRLRSELDGELPEDERVFIAATKATVIAADLAGSALPSAVEDPTAWLRDRCAATLTEDQLSGVVRRKIGNARPRPFQAQTANAEALTTILEAGCGSGKTAAAYLWAARHAAGRRLFFTYPTTGTASEGFAGYLSDPDFEALLIHGRARADYRLRDNLRRPRGEELDFRAARLEALETWPVPAAVCTVHTVLGLLENVRRGLFAWPALVRAAFVFDEVHAYSDKLFSYFLRFLEAFRAAPVLIMTATLPPARRHPLEEVAGRRGAVAHVRGSAERERAPRYVLRRSDDESVWTEIADCLGDGGKVLWVCNTVQRAMAHADEAARRAFPVQRFHSRFRYCDRVARQRAIVEGFAAERPPMLAVTTQVAEISLDLSADVLVSETAPVPALIQRLGRLNRYADEPAEAKPALLVDPPNARPYEPEELDAARAWLDAVATGSPVSQADLADAFQALAATDEAPRPAPFCEWLDAVWQTRTGERAIEEAGYSIDVVRAEDLGSASPVELAVPMPLRRGIPVADWPREGRYVVAPAGAIAYDAERGAEWTIP